MGNGAGVTDARQDEITRRRLVAVAVTVVCLVALIVLVGGLGSPSRGNPGARHSASKGVSANARASGNLLPGSDPSVLPGPVLIADRDNNRLLEVSPTGQVLWRFPEAGDLAPGQSFNLPDDAFFSPNGSEIVATQEDDFVISVVDVAHRRIVYRYGHPGVPGSEPGYLHNPDDAMLTPGGAILSADIKNCRIVVIRPPAHHLTHQLGETGNCTHELGVSYGSPNGAFPMSNGDTVVTEINGDWIDVLGPTEVRSPIPTRRVSATPRTPTRCAPACSSPSTTPIRERSRRSRPPAGCCGATNRTGADALDQPSLALPLPNGDVLANDDKNQRVIVVDPHTNRSSGSTVTPT